MVWGLIRGCLGEARRSCGMQADLLRAGDAGVFSLFAVVRVGVRAALGWVRVANVAPDHGRRSMFRGSRNR